MYGVVVDTEGICFTITFTSIHYMLSMMKSVSNSSRCSVLLLSLQDPILSYLYSHFVGIQVRKRVILFHCRCYIVHGKAADARWWTRWHFQFPNI